MAAKTAALAELPENKTVSQDEPTDDIASEADYAEDRPVALLAERQRKFQKSLRGHYVDAEMPPA